MDGIDKKATFFGEKLEEEDDTRRRWKTDGVTIPKPDMTKYVVLYIYKYLYLNWDI